MATGASSTMDTPARLPRGFKRRLLNHLLPEVAPLLIFFLVFMWKDLIWATGVYAVATAVAFAISWSRHKRLPVLPMVSTALVMFFAGLTLALGEESFIKIKPTVVNGFYGLVIGLGWLFGYRLLEKVLQPECYLKEPGLRILTIRTSLYLLSLACLNELVWRNVSTEQWVLFKVFVMVALNLAFALTQLPLARRYLVMNRPD